ncbi:hypothetical protein JCM30237_24450 [Halolamina litorea]
MGPFQRIRRDWWQGFAHREIYGDDELQGYFWEVDDRKYYYIETTGVGWGIGDLPDEYKDTSAYTNQV